MHHHRNGGGTGKERSGDEQGGRGRLGGRGAGIRRAAYSGCRLLRDFPCAQIWSSTFKDVSRCVTDPTGDADGRECGAPALGTGRAHASRSDHVFARCRGMRAPGAWCGQSAPFSNFSQIPARGCFRGWPVATARSTRSGGTSLILQWLRVGRARPTHGIQAACGSRDCALAVSRVQTCGRQWSAKHTIQWPRSPTKRADLRAQRSGARGAGQRMAV